MNILKLCKGKHDDEVNSWATDFEGLTKDVGTFADSIEEHDGVKYTTPESRMEIVQFIMKNPFFSLYILMDILIRTVEFSDLCYRGQESEYYPALVGSNTVPTENAYRRSMYAFLFLFIRFKPSAEVQLSILKLWLIDGDPGSNDEHLAFIVSELTTLYLEDGTYASLRDS